MQTGWTRQRTIFASVLVAFLGVSPAVFADDHLHGVIAGRGNDGALLVRTDDASNIIVVVDDSTKVRRLDGARKMKMSSSTLIPGLRVSVDGTFESESRFLAQRVEYKRSDLKVARDIQSGLVPTDARVQLNSQRIQQNAQQIKQQEQMLQRQGQEIATNKERIAANDQKLVATSGEIAATNARITNLDDYNVIATMTVYFANGKATIPSKYKTQLQQFAEQAKSTQAAVVQVQGYASAVGPEALNQQLSMKRADAVTSVLQQSGVMPTNVIVPAAMGTTGQVASNKTSKGQSENRRAVITILQSKGVAGR